MASSECDGIEDEDDKKDCEKALDKSENIQDKIDKETKAKNVLQQNLTSVQKSLLLTEQSLNETQKNIEDNQTEIERQNKQIELLNQKNELFESALSSTLRSFYLNQQGKPTFLEILDRESNKKGFMSDENDLNILQSQVIELMDEIKENKEVIQKEKDEVEEKKKKQEDLLALQKDQQQTLVSQKKQVQVEIYTKEATISELNAKLSEVESDLSNLLGKSVEANDIVEAVEIASKKTGVRKAFLFGELIQETNLGSYTGGCTYKNANMHSYDIPVFKRIMSDLGYKLDKKKVSCGGKGYSGGAMGVAQFIPTTWAGYEAKIKKYTGHSPVDPWNITDGVMAMAIKLANDGATSKDGEFDAARRYYCGSNISRSSCINYANKVLYWAKNYKDKLE